MAKDKSFWDWLIDAIQVSSIAFVLLVVFVCVLTLILFDVLIGAGTMMYLTNNQVEASFVISMATTGLLIALMMVGQTALTKGGNKLAKSVGIVVLIAASAVYIMDVVFDSLAADVLRYNAIVKLGEIPDGNIQLMFRVLIGGISTVGESLAVAIIVGMPVLKDIVTKALPKRMFDNKPTQYSYKHPQAKNNKFEFGKFGKQRSETKLTPEVEEALKKHKIN